MKKKLLIIWILFLLEVVIHVNNLYSQLINSTFERITTKDGLPQSTVNCIIQDKKGFMWFATYGGICRYDGYTFKTYRNIPDDKNSLSDNGSTFLYEDSDGYIWVVNNANEGLDKFDPVNETFTNYKNDPNDSTSISSNEVYSVEQDRSGNIWICAKNALNLVINEKRGEKIYTSFKRFYNVPSTTNFTMVYETKNGKLLLFADYLYYFDRKYNKMHRTNIPLYGTSNTFRIMSVSEDKSGNLWLGTNLNGIIKLLYNKHTQNFEYSELNKINVTPNNSNCVLIDEKDRIWIGTENKGLFLYDAKEDRLINFSNDKTDATSISDNTINSLLVDRTGVLWIGTFSQGLCKLNLNQKEFFHFKSIPGNKNSLSGNSINSIHSSVPGELWIGIDLNGGVNQFIYDHDEVKKIIHYKHDSNKTNTIGGNNILCLVQRKNKEVWAGSAFGTVSKIIPEKPGNIGHPIIKAYNINLWTFCIYEDRQGTLWGGTWGGGLWRYDDKTDKFTYYSNDPSNPFSLCESIIWSISEDNAGNIWIGGHSQGLSILPEKEKNKLNPQFINFKPEEKKPNSLSNNTVNVFFQDHTGTMWIGTNSGLNKVIIKDNNFSDIHSDTNIEFFAFHMKDGLPSECINGILEDNHGNLWLSTTNGLSKFNIQKNTFTNYNESDGLQSNEFNHNSYFKDQNGRMYFGGFNGFNVFYPDSIKPNPFIPKVVFTDLKIFNSSVKIGEKINGDIILSKSINDILEIILSHANNIFTLEFSALHYTEPERNQYAYKLEGFEKEWNYVGNKREATYTNLNPGNYIFKVKACNNDGIWNEEGISLKIKILPPWWKTWWVRMVSGLLLTAGLFAIYFVRVAQIRKRNIYLKREVQKRTRELNDKNILLTEQTAELNETNTLLEERQQKIEEQAEELSAANDQLLTTNNKLNELNTMKDKFFSIIGHDLKNPINVIMGFSEMLKIRINSLSTEKRDVYIDNIFTSARNTYNLLENLLDWARSQSGRKGIEPESINLIQLINSSILLLKEGIHEKQISVSTEYPEVTQQAFCDSNMADTIIRNLLSNAVKFTRPGGKISVKVTIDKKSKLIKTVISDTGIGIPISMIGKLFSLDRSYSTEGTAGETGTGLGLILCKEFVEKNNGEIWVESEPDKGSAFTFTLPLSKD